MLLISHTAAGSTNGNTVTSAPIDTTDANLIVVYFVRDGLSIFPYTNGFSDSVRSSFTATGMELNVLGGHPQVSGFVYVDNPTTSTTYTVTFDDGSSGDGTAPSIVVAAFNIETLYISANVGENSESGTETTIQPGNLTPPGPYSLLVTGLGYNTPESTVSINASFSIIDTVNFTSGKNYGASLAYLVTGSAISPTWTVSTASELTASMLVFAYPAYTPAPASTNIFTFASS